MSELLTPEEIMAVLKRHYKNPPKRLTDTWIGSLSNDIAKAQLSKVHRPEREKIFETIYYHKFPNAIRYKIKPILHDIGSEELTDQISALFDRKENEHDSSI